MKICSQQHSKIVYEDERCPLCFMRSESYHQMRTLESKLELKDQEIESLQSKITDLACVIDKLTKQTIKCLKE